MISKFIKNSPYCIKQPIKNLIGVIPYKFRSSKEFINMYNFLQNSQWWTREEHEQYQIKQLQKLLIHSYNNVPYYNRLFKDCGFDVYKFKYLDDIECIPFLTKKIVSENIDQLKAKNFPQREFVYASTGGTSGKQLKFFTQKNLSFDREWAFMTSQWNRVKFDFNKSKRIILRNQILPKGKLYIWDNYCKGLVVDTYHLTDENIKLIIDKINKIKIPYIHTYPSAITIICDFIKRTGYGFNYNLQGVLASSENIYDGQREFIEKTLNTRMFSWFGHSEQCILAGECEKSNKYHIFSEYGYTELIDETGNVINEPLIKGELVGTSFNNYVMPFIRYKTADYASYAKEQKCECGRNYRLLESVEGRWLQEMIVTSKGNKISITALNMHSDIFDNVKNFQFYQEKKGVCFINIVKKENYNISDEEIIIEELYKKLGNDITLKVNYVDKIKRTKGGKYKFLIQKLKI